MSEKRSREDSGIDNSLPPPKKFKIDDKTTRAGGVYIPPHRLRKMAEQTMDKNSKEYQRMTWDALRKSINGLINKVNISNIGNIVPELFQENIIRGRGLLCRSIMKAQLASPTFTQVYAALIAVINTEMAHIGELLVTRLVIQFCKSFKRNDKIQLLASTRFLAHLLNQQIAGEIVALQILSLLLERPSDDSVEVACEFITQCGYVLQSLSPEGFNGVFERFRAILHEGIISKRVQYIIEHVFAVRKSQFAEFPGVIEELDLIDVDDQITHEDITLDAELDGQDKLNYFHFDENFLQNEERYQVIKKAILSHYSDFEDSSSSSNSEDSGNSENESDTNNNEDDDNNNPDKKIIDMTESKLLDFKRKIYIIIMSSLDFQECAHKIRQSNFEEEMHIEVARMVVECCLQARTFLRFAALLGQQLCILERNYQELFETCFEEQYNTIHRLETNAIRNCAKFFAHLLHTFAINWEILEIIRLNERDTNASSRIFIKILFQELVEFLGLSNLNTKLQDETLKESFLGIFPKDNPRDTRFSINFFTSIGLGGLTDDLRTFLKTVPQQTLMDIAGNYDESSDSSSDTSSDSSDSSSDTSSDSSSDISSTSSSDISSSDDSSKKYSSRRKSSYNRSPKRQVRSYSSSRSPIRRSSTKRSPIKSRSPISSHERDTKESLYKIKSSLPPRKSPLRRTAPNRSPKRISPRRLSPKFHKGSRDNISERRISRSPSPKQKSYERKDSSSPKKRWSRSPPRRRSPERLYKRSSSPQRRPRSPERRISPKRQRSPPYIRKSPSPPPRRRLSHERQQSPPYRRAPSPDRRRSPPRRNISPERRWSRSPPRRRSPFRQQSPPARTQYPERQRSPPYIRRQRSPSPPPRRRLSHERQQSPPYRRAPSPDRRRRSPPRRRYSPRTEYNRNQRNRRRSPPYIRNEESNNN